MKIKLSNIGKIKEADVTINGITVIAGENNTGKSTVGKALYAMFNSFTNIDERINEERVVSIKNSLLGFYSGYNVIGRSPRGSGLNIEKLERASLDIIDIYNSKTDYEKEIEQYLFDDLNKEEINKGNSDELEKTLTNIYKKLNIATDKYMKKFIQENFSEEFSEQINNKAEKSVGEITLTINKIDNKVIFNEDFIESANKNLDIFTEAIYLDDPFVLDESPKMRKPFFSRILAPIHYYAHKDRLRELLYNYENSSNLIDELITNDRIGKIIKKLKNTCDGKIFFEKNGKLMYKITETGQAFNVANLSTGLKTFVILQTLLLNGIIKDKSLIILDEPEIHLHPEWQLLFAELIVMLQKEFNLHILLNTHSPYFLQAIEVFAEKYGVDDKCEYYLSYNEHNESFVKCVTGNLEVIYAKLARPLQVLENLRYVDDK